MRGSADQRAYTPSPEVLMQGIHVDKNTFLSTRKDRLRGSDGDSLFTAFTRNIRQRKVEQPSEHIDASESRPATKRKRKQRLAQGAAVVVTGLALAACSSHRSTPDMTTSVLPSSASATVSSTPSSSETGTRPATSELNICSPGESDHLVEENGAVVDDSPQGGVVVTFLANRGYNDKHFPGPSIDMMVSFKDQWENYKFTRVASHEDKGFNGVGGLVDVTKPTPFLNLSHPATGIKPGDVYTIYLGAGDTTNGKAKGKMDSVRKYKITVGRGFSLKGTFEGCAPLGADLPSYREGTPQI